MKTRNIHLSAFAAASFAALMLAACDQPSKSGSAATPPRTADKLAASTDKLAASTENAAAKVADATDDAAVTTKVKTALLAEPGLRSLEIHVDTKDGVVTLSGTPDSAISRDRAKEVTLGVAGVKNVVDQMRTKS
jgi:osmotically-inducible protein OsmY